MRLEKEFAYSLIITTPGASANTNFLKNGPRGQKVYKPLEKRLRFPELCRFRAITIAQLGKAENSIDRETPSDPKPFRNRKSQLPRLSQRRNRKLQSRSTELLFDNSAGIKQALDA
ncbi:MAG: hypothetical protein CMJ77_07615 [Planctomycetaceae bacterium]|nr:hypothetical protein [Planctomycetaceae bacterium]